jgi:hypothetical protein
MNDTALGQFVKQIAAKTVSSFGLIIT